MKRRALVIQHHVVGSGHAHDVRAAGHGQQGHQIVHVVLIGLGVIVVGTEWAAAAMTAHGAADKRVSFVVDRVLEPEGLRAAHQRLTAELGVRYLACEGGETILRALHGADVLDEVFVTTTDATIDESKHVDRRGPDEPGQPLGVPPLALPRALTRVV